MGRRETPQTLRADRVFTGSLHYYRNANGKEALAKFLHITRTFIVNGTLARRNRFCCKFRRKEIEAGNGLGKRPPV